MISGMRGTNVLNVIIGDFEIVGQTTKVILHKREMWDPSTEPTWLFLRLCLKCLNSEFTPHQNHKFWSSGTVSCWTDATRAMPSESPTARNRSVCKCPVVLSCVSHFKCRRPIAATNCHPFTSPWRIWLKLQWRPLIWATRTRAYFTSLSTRSSRRVTCARIRLSSDPAWCQCRHQCPIVCNRQCRCWIRQYVQLERIRRREKRTNWRPK